VINCAIWQWQFPFVSVPGIPRLNYYTPLITYFSEYAACVPLYRVCAVGFFFFFAFLYLPIFLAAKEAASFKKIPPLPFFQKGGDFFIFVSYLIVICSFTKKYDLIVLLFSFQRQN
jgi:hypothetical protein